MFNEVEGPCGPNAEEVQEIILNIFLPLSLIGLIIFWVGLWIYAKFIHIRRDCE